MGQLNVTAVVVYLARSEINFHVHNAIFAFIDSGFESVFVFFHCSRDSISTTIVFTIVVIRLFNLFGIFAWNLDLGCGDPILLDLDFLAGVSVHELNCVAIKCSSLGIIHAHVSASNTTFAVDVAFGHSDGALDHAGHFLRSALTFDLVGGLECGVECGLLTFLDGDILGTGDGDGGEDSSCENLHNLIFIYNKASKTFWLTLF